MWIKRIVFAAVTLAVCAGLTVFSGNREARAEDLLTGLEIMNKVSITRQLLGSEAVVTMSIYNKRGEKRERKIAMATKMYDNGATEKRVYRFLSPADVKGTGVLTFDYKNKNDDMWIYLPALHKTRRIVGGGKAKSFMGSEFTYADMNTPILDNYNLKVKKEEKVDGVNCYVVEMLPKNNDVAKEEKYSKKLVWVAKKEFTIRKAVYYDLDGELLKELTCKDIKLLDTKLKRYRPMKMEMVNKQNKRRSVLVVDKIESNPDVKDDYFTTAYLEKI